MSVATGQLLDRSESPPALIRQARAAIGHGVRTAIELVGPTLFGSLTHVDTTEPVVALTFDDGPHPEYTDRLLEVLDRHGARATFFALGMHAARYPNIVRRQINDGHTVGNHTWDHTPFHTLPRVERLAQIRRCHSALAPFGARLFRSPWGGQTLASRLDLWTCRYQVVMWSVDVHDWVSRDGETLARHLAEEIRPGSVVLLHDGIRDLRDEAVLAASRLATVEAVDRLLERMKGRYRFVTVPQLLRHGRPVRVNWYDPWYW